MFRYLLILAFFVVLGLGGCRPVEREVTPPIDNSASQSGDPGEFGVHEPASDPLNGYDVVSPQPATDPGAEAEPTGVEEPSDIAGQPNEAETVAPVMDASPTPDPENRPQAPDVQGSETEPTVEATEPPDAEPVKVVEPRDEPVHADKPTGEGASTATDATASGERVETSEAGQSSTLPDGRDGTSDPDAEATPPETAKSGPPPAVEPTPTPEPEVKWHKDWKAFYEAYATLLKTYVDDKGDVDYFELRRKRLDLIGVQNAMEAIKLAEYEQWETAEKAAFWINAHNICALRVVVDNYPIKPRWPFNLMYPNGIMQIPGARTKIYFRLVEREYSLTEMERDRLLKQFGDVRYMFALSHATRGAGFLRTEPFYPDRLDKQVDEQVRRFLKSPRGLRIDRDAGVVQLSDMFIWYKDTFIAKYGQVRRFRNQPDDVRAYLNFVFDFLPEAQTEYLLNRTFTVTYISYDWALNDRASP